MRHKLLSILLLLPVCVKASPFLTAAPQCYDISGSRSECPSHYEYSEDAGATWQELASQNDSNQIWIYHDLSSLAQGNAYSWRIRAANVWGVSPEIPFDFGTGVPVSPTGFLLVAP